MCVVTGAASGLGLAAAQRLVEEGGRVMLTDINASAVAECAELLGANAGAMTLDVRNRDQWRAVIDASVDRWGRLDVMVNNAGVARPGTIESVTDDDWDTVLGINLYGVMLGTQFAIGQMKRNGVARSSTSLASAAFLASRFRWPTAPRKVACAS